MELGKRLKEVRLSLGLSQRELCGDEITRNMLSQIENGSAKPSMDTLKYLAARLGKPVSYFLEEETVTSPNQAVMAAAREARKMGDWRGVLAAVADYRGRDPLFDEEKGLLMCLCKAHGISHRDIQRMLKSAVRQKKKTTEIVEEVADGEN